MTRAAAVLFVGLIAVAPQTPVAALPGYFKVPSGAEVDPNTIVDETYGEANIPNGTDAPNVKRGHHWSWAMRFTDIDAASDGSANQAWKRLPTAMTGAGWVLRQRFDTSPLGAVLAFQKAPVDALMWMQIFSSSDIRVEVVESRTFTATFTLPPPAATREAVSATQS